MPFRSSIQIIPVFVRLSDIMALSHLVRQKQTTLQCNIEIQESLKPLQISL